MVSIQTFLKSKDSDLFTHQDDPTTAYSKTELDGEFQFNQEACTKIQEYYDALVNFLKPYKKGFKE